MDYTFIDKATGYELKTLIQSMKLYSAEMSAWKKPQLVQFVKENLVISIGNKENVEENESVEMPEGEDVERQDRSEKEDRGVRAFVVDRPINVEKENWRYGYEVEDRMQVMARQLSSVENGKRVEALRRKAKREFQVPLSAKAVTVRLSEICSESMVLEEALPFLSEVEAREMAKTVKEMLVVLFGEVAIEDRFDLAADGWSTTTLKRPMEQAVASLGLRKKILKASTSTSSFRDKICYNCKEKGHTARFCRKKSSGKPANSV